MSAERVQGQREGAIAHQNLRSEDVDHLRGIGVDEMYLGIAGEGHAYVMAAKELVVPLLDVYDRFVVEFYFREKIGFLEVEYF